MGKYTRAQARIASGLWKVDAATGIVTGQRGPIGSLNSCGYVFLTMSQGRGKTNQNALAHRVIWESVHGPIPDGLTINHINGVKTDNRLSNLELMTAAENSRHAHRTGLASGASGGERHPMAQLTQVEVDDIRQRVASGERQCDVALGLGLSRQQVSSIVRRRSWAAA